MIPDAEIMPFGDCTKHIFYLSTGNLAFKMHD